MSGIWTHNLFDELVITFDKVIMAWVDCRHNINRIPNLKIALAESYLRISSILILNQQYFFKPALQTFTH